MLTYPLNIAYRRLLTLPLLLLAMLSTQVWSKDSAPQVLMSATYKGEISGWDVELERTLTQYPNGRYLLRSYASKVFASIEETSIFTLQNGQLRPQEYRYERSIFGKKSVEKIVYDWDKKRAQYTRSDRKKNNTEHTLTPGVLDPALYQLAIQADLAKDHDGLRYRFVKRKAIEQYELKAKTNETVALADKKYDAAVVLRKDPDSEKSTKVWVIPALNHIIAKIHHVEKDGDAFEISLTKFAVSEDELNKFYRAFSNNDKAQQSQPQP